MTMPETANKTGAHPRNLTCATTQITPDVTIVLISYNDAEHLPAALLSALSQTLRNIEIIVVDDCSSDSTQEEMETWLARDPRIRYERLPENSGGCGAPRNRGIELACGNYVMFLDSDDELELHAAKNMLLAAEKADADLVCGKMVRRHLGTGKITPWYQWLYSEPANYVSLAERPELIHDTTSTNKLYHLEFLRHHHIGFETDLHYEDLLFTARVFNEARGISIIPETVYEWKVYADEERISITNQRQSLRNLDDRIEAVTGVSRILADQPEEVQYQLHSKALRHHYRLYINDLIEATHESADAIVQRLRSALSQLPSSAFESLSTWERLAYAYVLATDCTSARAAALALQLGVETGRVLTIANERYWTGNPEGRLPGGPIPRRLARLAEGELGTDRYSAARLFHEMESIHHADGGITLRGKTPDLNGQLSQRLQLAEFVAIGKVRAHAQRVPLEVSFTDGIMHWTATLPGLQARGLQDSFPRRLVVDTKLASGSINRSPLRLAPELASLQLPNIVPGQIGRLLPKEIWSSTTGKLRPIYMHLQATGPRSRLARKLNRLLGRLRRMPRTVARRLAGPFSASSRFGQALVYPMLRKLPVRRDTALFESNLGKSVGNSPLAIHRSLAQSHPGIRVTWSAPQRSLQTAGIQNTRSVRRGTYGYLSSLARSEYLVDDQSFPRFFRRREGQRYLQTWHGVPFKKMGLDLLPDFPTEKQMSAVTRFSRQWNGLLIPCPFFEDVFVPAFDFRGDLIRYGTPRNDTLVTKNGFDRNETERRLDIPAGRQVILYAPTFRKSLQNRKRAVPLPFSLAHWQEEMGKGVILLVRAHYLNRFSIPAKYRGFCVDVTDHDNLNELLLISDLLITDYSSIMFDYAVLDRPIVNFCRDYQRYYNSERGAYFDLRVDSPGYFVQDPGEFFPILREALSEGIKPQHIDFRKQFCPQEDGNSSSRAVSYLVEGTMP